MKHKRINTLLLLMNLLNLTMYDYHRGYAYTIFFVNPNTNIYDVYLYLLLVAMQYRQIVNEAYVLLEARFKKKTYMETL